MCEKYAEQLRLIANGIKMACADKETCEGCFFHVDSYGVKSASHPVSSTCALTTDTDRRTPEHWNWLWHRKETGMGCFTWTDAARKPRMRKDGSDFMERDKVGYDCWCKAVCPDGTEIEEPSYEGYGMFGGHDIYDLVVDWNRKKMKDIRMDDNGSYFDAEAKKIKELVEKGLSDDEITEEMKKLHEAGKIMPYAVNEWKRILGIHIACLYNAKLPYPIKITRSKKKMAYEDLVPSENCQ